jgi:hypothetical protein
MDHRRLRHQPTAPNKLICGWTLLVFQAMQSASQPEISRASLDSVFAFRVQSCADSDGLPSSHLGYIEYRRTSALRHERPFAYPVARRLNWIIVKRSPVRRRCFCATGVTTRAEAMTTFPIKALLIALSALALPMGSRSLSGSPQLPTWSHFQRRVRKKSRRKCGAFFLLPAEPRAVTRGS